jgi:hypothetical protein
MLVLNFAGYIQFVRNFAGFSLYKKITKTHSVILVSLTVIVRL